MFYAGSSLLQIARNEFCRQELGVVFENNRHASPLLLNPVVCSHAIGHRLASYQKVNLRQLEVHQGIRGSRFVSYEDVAAKPVIRVTCGLIVKVWAVGGELQPNIAGGVTDISKSASWWHEHTDGYLFRA